MRKKGYKGRCEKKNLGKSQEVCRTYDAIQFNYADVLQNDNSIQEIRCNVLMDGLAEGAYTSDLPEGYSIWGIVVLTSLIWKIRPVNNESRPVSSGEYKSFVSKLKVVLIVMMMVAVVLEINHNNTYLNIMISGLLLTAITLIMGKVKYRQYKT